MGQVIKRFKVGMAGKDIAALALQQRGGGSLQLRANAFRLILGRVKAIVRQCCELLQQAVEHGVGIPHRLVVHRLVERREPLQRGRFEPARQ